MKKLFLIILVSIIFLQPLFVFAEVERKTNLINITDPTPYFSAIYNDPDSGDISAKYVIQVSTSTADNWLHVDWNSGTTTMASTTESTTSPALTYTGPALASSTSYYWRIRFIDEDDATGAWSTVTNTFCFAEESGSSSCSPNTTGGIQNFIYTYDKVGNITKIVDTSKKTVSGTFSCVELYRIIISWAVHHEPI